MGLGLKAILASVLYVSSGVTPEGKGIEAPVCRFVGVMPEGSVVCALLGIAIIVIKVIRSTNVIVIVDFS